MFAGENVFLMMVMVLSETEAVREGVLTAKRDVGTTCEGVAIAVDGGGGGGGGGVPVHPQVVMSRRIMTEIARMCFIDAGQIFPFNKVMETTHRTGVRNPFIPTDCPAPVYSGW
jgi:hypothetical protein